MPVLLIAGLVSLVLGLILFFAWIGYIVAIVKAILPAAFIGAGAVAAYLGWEEMKDQKSPNIDFSNPDEASRYKAEAVAYQERINEMTVAGPDEAEKGPESKEEAAPEAKTAQPGDSSGAGSDKAEDKGDN